MDHDVMLDLFQSKLNHVHTELKLAALFDSFFSQCDRHPQNYFLNEHGKHWAIENDQVWCMCVCVWSVLMCVFLCACVRETV